MLTNHSPFDARKVKKLLLISMLGNIIFMLAYEIVAIIVGIGTYGIFYFLVFLPILNVISLIMDIRTYFKLKNPRLALSRHRRTDPEKIISTLQFTSILEIGTTATGNIISLITGVLIMTNLEKAELMKISNQG